MSLRATIVRQFKRPHGLPGRMAGLIMANRPSNRQRNEWTVGLLALEPGYRVLEIGCGPGLALKACAATLSDGYTLGIDHSEVMVAQARRRLSPEIKAGRAEVRPGSLADLGNEPATWDRVFSLNVVQFLSDPDEAFRAMGACLADRGIVATTYQPRSKNPTRENALDMASRIEASMKRAGFGQIGKHELPLSPAPAICVTGMKA